MEKVKLSDLKVFFYDILCASGLTDENAKTVTEIYMRTTMHGTEHHNIYYLPQRLVVLKKNSMKANPSIQLLKKFEALESYDGDNGLGEICSSFIMDRAKELADKYGIGFCTIRNSNHFLAASPYIEKAAEEGYLAVIFSKTAPVMNAPGSIKKVASSCPMGFAVDTNKGYPIMLDICLAYASMGKIHQYINSGKSMPSHWGMDAQGVPTTDPSDVQNGGVATPIGDHKGFGLSLLIEILTGVLSGGVVIDETYPKESGRVGIRSQAALVFKTDGLLTAEEFKDRTTAIIDRIHSIEPEAHIPGQASNTNKKKAELEDSVMLKPEIIVELNQYAMELGVKPMITSI